MEWEGEGYLLSGDYIGWGEEVCRRVCRLVMLVLYC